MKNAVRNYEIGAWLRSPMFYLFIVGFFMFSLLSMLGTGGYFDGTPADDSKQEVINAPYYLSSLSFLFTKFLLFCSAVFGSFGLYKDYKHKAHAFIYSFPIKKSVYLNGKLWSALFAIFCIGIVTYLGIYIGELLLGNEHPQILPNSILGYGIALGVYLLPTLVTVGLFVFVAVGHTRNFYAGFVVILCFALFQILLEQLLFQFPKALAILDPFGQNAFLMATKDWSFHMKNEPGIPLNIYVIINRALWLLIGIFSYLHFYKVFDFRYAQNPSFPKKPKKTQSKIHAKVVEASRENIAIQYETTRYSRIQLFFLLLYYDFRSIIKSWLFIVPCCFGALVVFFIQLKISRTGEFNFLPLTRLFIGAPLILYAVIITLTTFLFSGLITHRARQYKMNGLVDSTPVTNAQLMGSKIGAVGLMHLVQLFFFVVVSMSIQAINGYYHFELELYTYHLLVLLFPVLLVWNITSQFVHNLIPNLFLGLFALLSLWLSAQAMPSLGVQTHLLKFNYLPNLEYSDFYGYGHQLKGYLWLLGYWLSLALVLLVLLVVLWRRGSLFSLKERLRLAKSRLRKPLSVALMVLLFSGMWIGAKITAAEVQEAKAQVIFKSDDYLENYKQEWEGFGKLLQPMITDVALDISIAPKQGSFTAKGSYILVNQSAGVIDTLFVRTGFDEITQLDWQKKASLIKGDSTMKTYLYKLKRPLQPKDSIGFSFSIASTPNTLFSRNSNVLSNGTYIRQDILPRLGYQFVDHELALSDSLVHQYNYFHRDANEVNLSTTIRTAADQIAFAPGTLVATQVMDERAVYSFRTPQPIKFNFSCHSARFEQVQELHKKIMLEVLFTRDHQRNIQLMLEGLKSALDYNTKWFGEYPFDTIRIIEYPFTEGDYSATLTANNIPASEILFNINMDAMEDKILLPFYVMAHEITHQWFGNRTMPADAEGAKMLTESITEYITLCIYKNYFGEPMAEKFLAVQQKRYERGLLSEKGEERPLYKVLSHQEYIAYGKGAIAFERISEAIGKEKLHKILQAFIMKFQHPTNYFPTSQDLLQLFEQELEAKDMQFVEQWLTKIDHLNKVK